MKRFTFRIIVAVLTFTFGVVASALWIVGRIQPQVKTESQPSNVLISPPVVIPTVESNISSTEEVPIFQDVATYVGNRILALKGKVSGFESISREKNVYVKEYPFQPIVDYRHRIIGWKPLPDSEPPQKEAIFAKDGFMLVIWMVRGELTWKPERPPVEIGPYKIDAGVGGPQRDRIQPIIDKIVAEAAEHFNRKTQSNNSFNPTPR
jgi:hypothetical protein